MGGYGQGGGNSDDVRALLREGVRLVVGTSLAFAALKVDGSVVTWGEARCGGVSDGVREQLSEVEALVGSFDAFAALKMDGSVVTWGGESGFSDAARQLHDVQQLAATEGAFAAIKHDGSVVTWGEAACGGDSDAMKAHISSGVQRLISNGGAFLAVLSDGSLVTWGDADSGGRHDDLMFRTMGLTGSSKK